MNSRIIITKSDLRQKLLVGPIVTARLFHPEGQYQQIQFNRTEFVETRVIEQAFDIPGYIIAASLGFDHVCFTHTPDRSVDSWDQTPAGEEYRNLAPDPDLVAEWDRHHAERNAPRHPDQPHYSGPVALPDPAIKSTDRPPPDRRNIYDRAQALIAEKPAWSAGEHVVIWQGTRLRALIYEAGNDGGGLLFLAARNGNLGEEENVLCGHLRQHGRWHFTLSRRDYREWQERATYL